MQYSVHIKNISENDQLVLRLIFSLSAKARGRSHAYCLAESEHGENADILIIHSDSSAPAMGEHKDYIVYTNDNEYHGDAAFVLHKPLIASRVLNVLDRFIDERQTQASPVAAHVPEPVATSPQPEDTEMDFCISEQEASELAIVDDEALSNPSNAQNPPVPAGADSDADTDTQTPATVTSLMVRHKNKELEVSTQAFAQRTIDTSETRPRALVVDDSPSVRKQIELELELFNVDIDFAESVASAQAQLDTQDYDVAFLDVMLPDGDGFGICRTIKANSKQTKVIMLTGKATAADKIKGTMAGCDAYLVKPVGRMTFQNTVCNYLQLREQLEVIHA